MSDQPACACLRVKYDPIDNGDGTVRERWLCEDCETVFVKEFWLSEAHRKLREFERFAFESGETAGEGMAQVQSLTTKLVSVQSALDEHKYAKATSLYMAIQEALNNG